MIPRAGDRLHRLTRATTARGGSETVEGTQLTHKTTLLLAQPNNIAPALPLVSKTPDSHASWQNLRYLFFALDTRACFWDPPTTKSLLVQEKGPQIWSLKNTDAMDGNRVSKTPCRSLQDSYPARRWSRHKRESRLRSIRLLNNISFQREIFRVPIKSAAADGDDLSFLVCHESL